MDSEESWDEASMDVIKETEKNKKQRISIQNVKLKILHQILFIIERLKKERKYFISKGINDFEKIAEILNIKEVDKQEIFNGLYNCRNGNIKSNINDNERCDLDNIIDQFITLNMNKISTRIFFVIDKQINSFLEYVQNGNFITVKSTFNGNCFSVDFDGYILDQSIVFSKNCKNLKFFRQVINLVNKKLAGGQAESFKEVDIFKSLDEKRSKAIPSNLNKMKIHPLYITEECCSYREFIYPKRPIRGYIKGNPVFDRDNLKILKTEKGWYREGRVLKDQTPYRIYKDKKMFADFQTIPVEVNDLKPGVMDAFHPNFTPKNCIYVNYSSKVAEELGIPFSDCLVGFRYQERLIKGFFTYKKYCYIANYFIKEIEYYNSLLEKINFYEGTYQNWQKFLKKVKKYNEIQKRIQ